MTKELRRLSFVMLAMFLALFVSTSWIQVVEAHALNQHEQNRRTLYDSFEVQRGSIVAGGSVVAASVPSGDVYSWQRQYTDAAVWAPVTGWANPVLPSTSELEQAMNQALSGTADSQFLSRVMQIIENRPARGSNVLLTVDPELQRVAYDALQGYQGAIVATEPSTGRILAMVTSPTYDTNLLASHDVAAVDAAYDELAADPADPLFNRAIGGDQNPPGSTFKLVTVSAALSSGDYTPESTFPNPASWTIPETSNELHNFDRGPCGPGDTVTLATALRLSCNIPMAMLAVELGDDALREEAEKFGFNSEFEIPQRAAASKYPTEALSDAPTALTGFGQGDVQATPLQIAMVSAAIANGGVVMNPHLVDSVVAPDLTVQETVEPSEYGRALTEDIAAQMSDLMVANVQDGAASGARMDGVEVAGKTGTAEHGVGDPYTLWFTGFAPAEDPEIAITVMIENGGGLGQAGTSNGIAAPIARQVIEAVLNR